jgi:hypothetical protein
MNAERIYTIRRTSRTIRGCQRTVITWTYTGTPDDANYDAFLDARFTDAPPDVWERDASLGIRIDNNVARWSYVAE